MREEARKNKVKEIMARGEKVVGTFCVSNSRAVIETLATSGMDYTLIDTEHFMTNPETIEQMITAAEAAGVTPFVRVQENVHLIDRCVSAGARGVMVPMIHTREQAQEAVNVMKYAPVGKRGVCNPRAVTYGARGLEDMLNFYQTENDNVMCILQMETIESYRNLPEILEVEGIDSIFVGRFDLTHSMGITGQFDDPEVVKIVENTLRMGKEKGLYMGIITMDAADTNKFFQMGYDWVSMAGDMMLLAMAAQGEMARIKRDIK
jgi:2-keto-3-deoxy-L-rhamnonate aldolase RhmA